MAKKPLDVLEIILGDNKERPTVLLKSPHVMHGEGWYFCVPEAFNSAMDIKKTQRGEGNNKEFVWTQGNLFSFKKGDTFYDTELAYQVWERALKVINMSVTVKNAIAVGPVQGVEERPPGLVEFIISTPNSDRTKLVERERKTVTQDEFVRILIEGPGVKNIEEFEGANEDSRDYLHYTGPSRIDKAMHVLEGILKGIASDGIIVDMEVKILKEWFRQHEDISHKEPFNEVHSRLKEALADGVLDEEEKADLLWFCKKFTTTEDYYDQITSDLQRLHGILAGIAADGVICKKELETLSDWLEENEHLKGNWPFDELEALILEVLRDGVIDAEEHKLLQAFFGEFLDTKKHKTLAFPLNEVDKPLMALCAVCPDVTIQNRKLCFTGKFSKVPRKELVSIVKKYGGVFSKGLTEDVDYLVIGADGNQAWAYSCYGRKVEKAINLRKQGKKLVIAHEHDFWDAVEELEE